GALCGIAGMLPDLDSDSGKPMREVFGATAVAVPLFLFHRMHNAGIPPEGKILLGGILYVAIRFGAAWLLKKMTVHRGMFHSLPAAAIAAEIIYLAPDCSDARARVALAGGVVLGFLSHLVLDEVYRVDAQGLKLRLNKTTGSALKFFSPHIPATLVTWLLLGVLTYLVGIDRGYLEPVHLSIDYPPAKKAADHP